MNHEAIDRQRRELLGATAGIATIALGAGLVLHVPVVAQPRTTPVTAEHRWGMLIDTNKCIAGCDACVTACERENGLNLQPRPAGARERQWENQRATWIRKVKLQDNLSGRITHLPLMCQHCAHPPCVDVCPTGASFKRADGIVMVDRHTCIGCRYCMMACPYKARSFVHERIEHKLTRAPRGKGCVESCHLCAHRLDEGRFTVACAEACAQSGQGAIVFGDLNDPQSPVRQALQATDNRQLREDLGLSTGVRYAGL